VALNNNLSLNHVYIFDILQVLLQRFVQWFSGPSLWQIGSGLRIQTRISFLGHLGVLCFPDSLFYLEGCVLLFQDSRWSWRIGTTKEPHHMLVISLSISHQIIKKHKTIASKLFKTKLFLYLEILSFVIFIIIFFNISGSLLNNYLI